MSGLGKSVNKSAVLMFFTVLLGLTIGLSYRNVAAGTFCNAAVQEVANIVIFRDGSLGGWIENRNNFPVRIEQVLYSRFDGKLYREITFHLKPLQKLLFDVDHKPRVLSCRAEYHIYETENYEKMMGRILPLLPQ